MVYQGRPSWLYYFGSLTVGGFFLLLGLLFAAAVPDGGSGAAIALVFGALVLLRPILGVYGSLYSVTRDTVTQRHGIISRNTSEVEVADVRSIQVRQSIVERLFGLGSVLVSSAGQGGVEVGFAGIKHPQQVAERIRQLRREPAAPAAQAAG